MATWVSKDKSSPNYGKEVTINDSGKIVPTSSVITVSKNKSGQTTYTTPKGTTTTNEAQAVNETLNAQKPNTEIQGTKPGTTAFTNPDVGGGKTIISGGFSQKLSEVQYYVTPEGVKTTNAALAAPTPVNTAYEIHAAKTPVVVPAKSTKPANFFSITGSNIKSDVANSGTYAYGLLTAPEGAYEKTNKFLVSTFIDPNYKQNIAYFGKKYNEYGGNSTASQFTAGAIMGAQKYVAERPLDIATTYAGGYVFSQGMAVASNVALRAGTVGPQALNLVGAGVMSGYAVLTGVKVASTSGTTQKGEVLGQELVKFAAFSGGAVAGEPAAREINLGKPRVIKQNAFGLDVVKYPQVEEIGGKVTQTKDFVQAVSLTKGDKPLVTWDKTQGMKFGEFQYQVPKEVIGKIASGYFPQTQLEMKYYKDVAVKINQLDKYNLIYAAQNTAFTNSRDIKPLSKTVKAFGEKGTQVMDTELKGLDYGSRTVEALMPGFAEVRGTKLGEPVANDIDKQLFVSFEKAQVKVANTLPKLELAGETVRVSEQNPTLVESRILELNPKGEVIRKWIHGGDIHSIGDPNDLQFQDMTQKLGLPLGQKPVMLLNTNKELVPSKQLSETNIDKLSTILQIQNEPGKPVTFAPPEHQVKSIKDYFAIQKYVTGLEGKPGDTGLIEKGMAAYKAEGFDVAPSSPKNIPSTPYVAPKSPSISIAPTTFKLGSMGTPSTTTSISTPTPKFYSASNPLKTSTPTSPSISMKPYISEPSKISLLSSKASPIISTSKPIKPYPSTPSMPYPSIPSPSSPYPSSPSGPSPSTPSPPIPKPSTPILPSIPLAGFAEPAGRYRPYEKARKERKKYVPSLTALISNLRAASGPTRGLLGTEIRPFIVGKKRRKKR